MLDMEQMSTKYELYVTLFQYYSCRNPDLAYLSLENAIYLAGKQEISEKEQKALKEALLELCDSCVVTVRKVSFIILSYNTIELTKQCIESIRNTCPDSAYEIVIVDNASTDGSVEWLRTQKDINLIENKENVGFPAGCNQGIRAAKQDNDIFLLNSDTIMMTNSLYTLRMGLYMDDGVGAVGAATNSASNNQMLNTSYSTITEFENFARLNNVPSEVSFELKSKLIMFAMLVRRDVFDEVGYLDERFSPGFFEDDDYGFRIMKAGYHNVLCWNSFIYHYGSKSFGKMPEKTRMLLAVNKNKLSEKWGIVPDEVLSFNQEFINQISEERNAAFRVLEIGCGLGETLCRIKLEYPNTVVTGVVNDRRVAELLKSKCDAILADSNWNLNLEENYDYIFINDFSVEANNMSGTVKELKENHAKNGKIVIKSKGDNKCRIL